MDAKNSSQPTGLLTAHSPYKARGQGKPCHSEKLFGPYNELVIMHAGEEYRLRITRNNKLILTK